MSMKSLQASTAYSFPLYSSPPSPPPPPTTCSRHHRLIRAQVDPSEKSIEIMRKFSEQYCRKSGTYFCVDKSVTSVVLKGLADHKDTLGAPLCPCRHYDDKPAEAGQGFWNCPCVPMRESGVPVVLCNSRRNFHLGSFKNSLCVTKQGKECHCMLFLTADNDFAGKEQTITLDEIRETTANM